MIEIMVVIAILAILLSLAIPSFSDSLRRSRVDSYVDQLASSIRLARAEAMSRNKRVVICPTASDGAKYDSSGAAQANAIVCLSSGNAWASGWAVFVDDGAGLASASGNGDWDQGEEILNHYAGPYANSYQFYLMGLAADGSVDAQRHNLTFSPRGQAGYVDSNRYALGSFFAVGCHDDDIGESGRNVRGFSIERSGRLAMAQHDNSDGSAQRVNLADNSGGGSATSTVLECSNT